MFGPSPGVGGVLVKRDVLDLVRGRSRMTVCVGGNSRSCVFVSSEPLGPDNALFRCSLDTFGLQFSDYNCHYIARAAAAMFIKPNQC